MRWPVLWLDSGARGPAASELTTLVYELLDAHADTMELAAELADDGDLRWRVQLDYLRALQRTGREALAHTTFQETP